MRFLRNKYKRVRTFKKAKAAWRPIIGQHPKTFAHWAGTTTFRRPERHEPYNGRLLRPDLLGGGG